MGRPKKYRKINCNPGAMYFKPRGVPMNCLEEVVLEAEEVEAIRLGDLKGYSHEESAKKMKISRPTFGRIINQARMKIADGILNGKALRISEELADKLSNTLLFNCKSCGYKARVNRNNILDVCPKCSTN